MLDILSFTVFTISNHSERKYYYQYFTYVDDDGQGDYLKSHIFFSMYGETGTLS